VPSVDYVSPSQGRAGARATIGGTTFTPGIVFDLGKQSVAGTECISTSCTVDVPVDSGTEDVIRVLGKSKGKSNPPADWYTYG
jgi:hypothetical protein